MSKIIIIDYESRQSTISQFADPAAAHVAFNLLKELALFTEFVYARGEDFFQVTQAKGGEEIRFDYLLVENTP